MSEFSVDVEPLGEEVIRLGLGDVQFLMPTEQVNAQYGITNEGESKLVIYVKDIEVLSVDPVTKKVRYQVTGIRQYMQNWDVGGSNLNPEFIGPPEIGNIE